MSGAGANERAGLRPEAQPFPVPSASGSTPQRVLYMEDAGAEQPRRVRRGTQHPGPGAPRRKEEISIPNANALVSQRKAPFAAFCRSNFADGDRYGRRRARRGPRRKSRTPDAGRPGNAAHGVMVVLRQQLVFVRGNMRQWRRRCAPRSRCAILPQTRDVTPPPPRTAVGWGGRDSAWPGFRCGREPREFLHASNGPSGNRSSAPGP